MNNKSILEFLVNWTKLYAKSRDVISRTIVSIEKDKEYNLTVKHKDKGEFYIIDPFIKDIKYIINKLDKEKLIILVIFNSKKNFDMILDSWKKFTEILNLKIIFVNPFSKTDNKWIVNPNMHQKVCDEASLKPGLLSMFNSVVSTTEEEIKQGIKNQKEYI